MATTKISPALTEMAWALQNKINPFPVGGTLTWDGATLSFTLSALAGDAILGWVEKRSGQADLAARLNAGDEVAVFTWAAGTFETTWPAMYAGSALEVTGPNGLSWLIAMDYPSGGAISQTLSVFSGRKKGKAWKRALAF